MEWKICPCGGVNFPTATRDCFKNKHRVKILAKACLDMTNADLLKQAALKTRGCRPVHRSESPASWSCSQSGAITEVRLIQRGGTKLLKLRLAVSVIK